MLISLVLALLLTFHCTIPALGAAFPDVTRTSVGEEIFDAINYVTDNGIMNGMDTGNFEPNTALTRGMFVTILYRYSGETGTYTNPFTDVGSNRYYTNPIGWAAAYGIVKGITETTFEPDTTLTRQQLLTILYRYAKEYLGITYSEAFTTVIATYADYSTVMTSAREAYKWALQYHLYQPSANYLHPRTTVIRADVALYITRFSLYIESFTDQSTFSFNNDAYTSSTPSGDLSAKYRMSNDLITLTKNSIVATAPAQISELHNRLDNMIGSTNYGLCYGSCIATYLDKIGKIDFNKNTCNSATLDTVPDPRTNLAVESVLLYYQFAQYINANQPAISAEYSTTTYSEAFSKILATVCDTLTEYGPVILIYKGYKVDNPALLEHAIIVESCSISYSNGQPVYTFTCLDPNYNFRQNYTFRMSFIIGEDGFFENAILAYNGYDEFYFIKISVITRDQLDFYDTYDFDGQYNTKSYVGTS